MRGEGGGRPGTHGPGVLTYGGDGRIWPEMPSPQLWVYQPPAVPSLLGELAVAGAGHPGVPL